MGLLRVLFYALKVIVGYQEGIWRASFPRSSVLEQVEEDGQKGATGYLRPDFKMTDKISLFV